MKKILIIFGILISCLTILVFHHIDYNYNYSQNVIAAIESDDYEEFQKLLDKDKNLNSRPYWLGIDRVNMPPLIYAITKDKTEYVVKLVEEGADVNNTDHPYDETPLMFALKHTEDFKIPRYLIDNGADIHIEVHGETALNYVFSFRGINSEIDEKEEFEFAMYLIDMGAEIETDTWHVIYDAVRMNNLLMVEYLVKSRNVDINIKDNAYGNTPLLWAVTLGSYDVTKWLIENGADLNVLNNEGKSAYDLAKKYEHLEIINLLNSYER